MIRIAVKESASLSDALRHMGVKEPGGFYYENLKRDIELLQIDTSHFLPFSKLMQNVRASKKFPLSEILVENSKYRGSPKKRLLKEGILRNECYKCKINSWQGKPLVLALEHKNGNKRDHRLENIELLCPNCHSQTPTFAGRNVKKTNDAMAEWLGI